MRTINIVVLAVAVLGSGSVALGQSERFDNPSKISHFVDGFSLSPAQVDKILASLDDSAKKAELVRQKMDAISILLKKELAKDDADEKKVIRYIDDISRAEAAIRKSKVLAWLRVRKLLTAKQRDAIKKFGKKPDVAAGPDCDRSDPLCGIAAPTVVLPSARANAPFVKPELAKLPTLGRVRDGAIWKKLVKPSVVSCAKAHGFTGRVNIDFDVATDGRGQVSRIVDGPLPFRTCVVAALAAISVGRIREPDEDRRYRIRLLIR